MISTMAFSVSSSPVFAQMRDEISEKCSMVRNDDIVKTIPKVFLKDARWLYGNADRSDDKNLMISTVYRCMNGRIRLCNAGANIVCAKPDTSERVTPELIQYCKQNPDDIVPMVVTGHSTIHSWKCVGKKPQIDSSEELDSRGFVESVWTPTR